jgi:hypothetical protein
LEVEARQRRNLLRDRLPDIGVIVERHHLRGGGDSEGVWSMKRQRRQAIVMTWTCLTVFSAALVTLILLVLTGWV